ncbi:MAG: hypothetical protein ABR554_00095 [Pyrinomonadaceae bacterium]
MKTSFPRLISFAAIISILAAQLPAARAQGLSASPLRNTPSDVERDAGRVQRSSIRRRTITNSPS